jgi:hypothetical protein
MLEHNADFQVIAEAFPKIAGELQVLWGTPKFNVYMEELEQDKTGQHRVGFPSEVLTALIGLGDEHDKQFPGIVLQANGKWIS